MRHLLEGGAYSSINVQGVAIIRGQRLIETRHLLEQIRYLYNHIHNSTVFIKQMVWQTRFIFTLFIKHVKKNLNLHHKIIAPARTLYKTQNTLADCYKTQKHLCRGVL